MYILTNVYAIRMAAVFMLALGTLWVRTRVMRRLFIALTYLLALVMLLAVNLSVWLILIFPAWVMVIGVFIPVESLRGKTAAAEAVIGHGG